MIVNLFCLAFGELETSLENLYFFLSASEIHFGKILRHNETISKPNLDGRTRPWVTLFWTLSGVAVEMTLARKLGEKL